MYSTLCGQKLPTLYTLKRQENSFLVDDVIPAPHTINPDVPATLSNIVMECVRTNPAKRPADMPEVASRLGIRQKTVETFREKIKRKLELSNSNQLIQHAVQWVLERT